MYFQKRSHQRITNIQKESQGIIYILLTIPVYSHKKLIECISHLRNWVFTLAQTSLYESSLFAITHLKPFKVRIYVSFVFCAGL